MIEIISNEHHEKLRRYWNHKTIVQIDISVYILQGLQWHVDISKNQRFGKATKSNDEKDNTVFNSPNISTFSRKIPFIVAVNIFLFSVMATSHSASISL